MKYTKKKAQAAIAAWGLSPQTEKVWKHRGAIPDEYASPPLPLRIAIARKLEAGFLDGLNSSVEEFGEEAQKIWDRYLSETHVPQDIDPMKLKQRLWNRKSKLPRS